MRRLLGPSAVVVGVAAAVRVVFGEWYLNYDARYALLWARDVSRGLTPDYEAPFAPTPHPLSTAWSALSLPFGSEGDVLMVWLPLLAFGLLVYLAYRLGAELFSPWVGIATALVVATRPALERDAALAYQDVPFAVLVVLAALLEARRPRRGWPVLAVLAVAGLLRPEAWALAGVYWLYLFGGLTWRDRIRLGALVVAAPILWAVMDAIVTGDALHSLHGTVDLARANDRRRSVGQAPYWTLKYFGYTLREPAVLAGPIGLAFVFRFRDRFARGGALPLAVAAVMTAAFAVNPIFGLPLIGRYIRTPSVFLAIFYGVALAGWLLLERDHPERRVWMGLAALAAIITLVFVPSTAHMARRFERTFANDGPMYADIRSAARSPAVRRAVRDCGPITTADHRPLPWLRYWLGTDPGSVVPGDGVTRPTALLFVPRRSGTNVRRFYGPAFPKLTAPPGARTVYENRSWRVVAKGCPEAGDR